MDFLKELIKATGNEYAAIAEDGIEGGDITGFISTGSLMFNALLGGSLFNGLPKNKVTALAGEEATGKTFFVIDMIKHFLDEQPKGLAIYFESEAAISKDMFVERGVDTKRVLILPIDTVQNFRTQILKILEKYEATPIKARQPMVFVLDSLGALSTTKEVNDTSEGKETADMTRAKVLRATFRTITQRLARAGTPLIITNHTYDEQGLFPKKIMGGGRGLSYSASTIVFLSKRKDKVGTDVVGNFITCTLKKGRLTKENTTCVVNLNYRTGISKYYGLLDLGVKHGVIAKVGNKYDLGDGNKYFEKAILKNAETLFTKELLEKLDVAAKKEYSYGGEEISEEEEIGEEGALEE